MRIADTLHIPPPNAATLRADVFGNAAELMAWREQPLCLSCAARSGNLGAAVATDGGRPVRAESCRPELNRWMAITRLVNDLHMIQSARSFFMFCDA
jgi:hypothetical protein